MTEAEWQKCDDWYRMLEFLSGRWTSRKATLYLCAGLRSLWELLYNEYSRMNVEMAERAVDGLASDDEMGKAVYMAESPTFGYDFDTEFIIRDSDTDYRPSVRRLVEMGVYTVAEIQSSQPLHEKRICTSLLNAAHIAYHIPYDRDDGGILSEHLLEHLSTQDEWPGVWLVREVAGNPYRSVIIDPAWLAWNEGTVRHIAQIIYDERAFDRLPILADALEDAGCDNADILNHCRSDGPHVRGCWVVDLLLGKE